MARFFFAFFKLFHLSLTFFRPEVPFNTLVDKIKFDKMCLGICTQEIAMDKSEQSVLGSVLIVAVQQIHSHSLWIFGQLIAVHVILGGK